MVPVAVTPQLEPAVLLPESNQVEPQTRPRGLRRCLCPGSLSYPPKHANDSTSSLWGEHADDG
ncbi:uncharacterized protein CCOS01_10708 [Colletotrichum costaricense]|uniref:Uncharacterized protein n=1 Tax=Colletotrichum costaricense TaxID=1209916 RepID=A0AAI9YRQ4_9PEZI|nr:uncharacterized protein CCOS01_10708 [Colletotrichum costaricense]KAK1520589.1 hypothetical protein CCOS01_10708 [Colletotrichum costaricense]